MPSSDPSIYEEILIESNDGSTSVDLRLGVQSIDYYEDIFSPTITLKMVITNTGNQLTVWGFINKTNPKFEIGTVLKAAGWATPTLNAGRGNLFDGYEIRGMRKYGPDYLI